METYRTMSPNGLHGSDFQATSWEDAEKQAEDAGYKVLDWIEHEGYRTLVIPDEGA